MEKRGPGRPATGQTVVLSVRVSQWEHAQLRKLATHLDTTVAEILRIFGVHKALEYGRRVNAGSDVSV